MHEEDYMNDQFIRRLILFIIPLVIIIALVYRVMSWLYRRSASTNEVAFVRTGFLGRRWGLMGRIRMAHHP